MSTRKGATKTIQMTIDESLLAEVDRAIQYLNTTHFAFICDALQLAYANTGSQC
jgi:hypothetical protein